ncbi:hypothetical protein PRZ48_009122 [Zasmidium cellare]|uniref:Adenosine deaminase domain-containing protein n=1 Tax=Zasmidium cellare TaxID=395010 RepID=A0ABR0EHF6_ZASCE|nr:hypothetical protein PRZ48_009122 [Zasmidium cellare]
MTQRNGAALRLYRNGPIIHSLDALTAAMESIMPDGSRMTDDEERDSFFDSYMEGFEALQTEEDYYDLAMNYFERAATMNVRYCELFFDPQGHTSRGVKWETMMSGFERAQKEARSRLGVQSQWIMCFLRDSPPESAMEHYVFALPYRHMIVGIGLDSSEPGNSPQLFADVFSLARKDGFKLTAHCDVDQSNVEGHIEQVLTTIGGTGADRIDHGLNAASDQRLTEVLVRRQIGMTLCPWSYLRHTTYSELGQRIRSLFDAGVLITINSDDPAYMEDCWVLHNFLLAKYICAFTNAEILRLARNAVTVCWAGEDVKTLLLSELDDFGRQHGIVE